MTALHDMQALRHGAVFLALGLLAACAGQHASKTAATTGQAVAAPAPAPLDVSYDWHGLVVIPFDTLLKSSPIALHEVLLFHDDAHASSAELGKDCYTVDGKPPRLVDQEPEEFLLCFSHDRLDRIEASVPMKPGEGPGVLARVCALWLKNSAPTVEGGSCAGREGDITFGAHLGSVPGNGSVDFQAQPSILSVILAQAAERATPAAAPEHETGPRHIPPE